MGAAQTTGPHEVVAYGKDGHARLGVVKYEAADGLPLSERAFFWLQQPDGTPLDHDPGPKSAMIVQQSSTSRGLLCVSRSVRLAHMLCHRSKWLPRLNNGDKGIHVIT